MTNSVVLNKYGQFREYEEERIDFLKINQCSNPLNFLKLQNLKFPLWRFDL